MTTIPVINVSGFLWGDDVLVIPEYSFGVQLHNKSITLSHEHQDYAWLAFDVAIHRLKWDSNRNALWELNYRLTRGK
jgi:dihydroneopterin triphosphate diphosphatase